MKSAIVGEAVALAAAAISVATLGLVLVDPAV
jgi:hypothetical protein